MDAGAHGPPLVPAEQPIDLIVSVTDFAGHKEQLTLNSPPCVTEQEHRLVMPFRQNGPAGKRLADVPPLAPPSPPPATFPGAFPPLTLRPATPPARNPPSPTPP